MKVYDSDGRLKVSTTGGVSVVDPKSSMTIESPTASEDVTFFYAKDAITLTQMTAVNTGTTPSVTWTVRHDPDRNATGTEVVTSGTTTTNTTTGDHVTTLNSANIPAGSFIWLETSATSGTVDTFNVTLFY